MGSEPKSAGDFVSIGLMAVGAVALVRRPVWLGAAALGFLAYEIFKQPGRKTAIPPASYDDPVDLAAADSFPASDPPNWSGSTAGSA